MKIKKGFVFRLKTDNITERLLHQQAGARRFTWNKALSLQLWRLQHGLPLLGYNDLAGYLQLWKQSEEYGFLREAHSQVLQQALKDLTIACRRALTRGNGVGFPKFKKKGRDDSFRYPQGVKIGGRRIYLPKIGWVRFYKSRDIEGKVKNITVKRKNGKWYVSIQTELEIADKKHPSNLIVGVDVGVCRLATLTDGKTIPPIKALESYEKKLKRAQRNLSRKKKFSKNWYKQKRKISRIWEKITNIRKDYLHKISTSLASRYAVIVVEELKIKNMTRSARGTKQNPGKMVKAKAGLNRSILEQSWGEFFKFLEYKLQWMGGKLIKVDAKGTSIECPVCEWKQEANRESQAVFHCKRCGFKADADWVGSVNVLKRGIKKLGSAASHLKAALPWGTRWKPVEGKAIRFPMKQEPVLNLG